MIVLASATVNCSSALAAAINRITSTSAVDTINAIFIANARLKWEPNADTPETWTEIVDTSEIWTEVADTAETWTEI